MWVVDVLRERVAGSELDGEPVERGEEHEWVDPEETLPEGPVPPVECGEQSPPKETLQPLHSTLD